MFAWQVTGRDYPKRKFLIAWASFSGCSLWIQWPHCGSSIRRAAGNSFCRHPVPVMRLDCSPLINRISLSYVLLGSEDGQPLISSKYLLITRWLIFHSKPEDVFLMFFKNNCWERSVLKCCWMAYLTSSRLCNRERSKFAMKSIIRLWLPPSRWE